MNFILVAFDAGIWRSLINISGNVVCMVSLIRSQLVRRPKLLCASVLTLHACEPVIWSIIMLRWKWFWRYRGHVEIIEDPWSNDCTVTYNNVSVMAFTRPRRSYWWVWVGIIKMKSGQHEIKGHIGLHLYIGQCEIFFHDRRHFLYTHKYVCIYHIYVIADLTSVFKFW